MLRVEVIYKALKSELPNIRQVCWASKPTEHYLLSQIAVAVDKALAREVERRRKNPARQ